MAVNNSLTPKKNTQDMTVEYKWGDSTITLSPEIVTQYLVSGGGNVSAQEIAMFINLCKYQHLNPFLKEAYLIKYGNSPAAVVVGKEAFLKRAMRNPSFEGYQAGVIILNKEKKEFEYRTGALAVPSDDELLVGGWAKVYVKGYQVPIEMAITYREYVGRKGNGEVNQQWQTKPATMLRKVALVQALREAFPEDLGGMYDSDELNIQLDETAPTGPVEIPPQDMPQDPQPDMLQGMGQQMPEQATMEELQGF